MQALKHDSIYDDGHYLTLSGYFHVFPLGKTRNGYYKCHLRYFTKKGNEEYIEWVIPSEYLEENGHFELNNDVYFARWLLNVHYGTVVNDDGKEEAKQFYMLSKMIDFWNVRIFGECPDESIN